MELLIPPLPDDLALLCLAKLPVETRVLLRCVSRAWRRALGRPKRLRLLICLGNQYGTAEDATWHVFDRMLCRWETIPPPSPLPPSGRWPRTYLDWAMYWRLFKGSHRAPVISMYGPSTFCLEMKETKTAVSYSWCPAMTMREKGRWNHAASASEDGNFVYVAGGVEGRENKRLRCLRSAERFNVKRRRWERLPPLHGRRGYPFGRMLSDGRFCISSGLPLKDDYQYGEAYDPATRQWSVVHCPLSYHPLRIAVLKGQCYCIDSRPDSPHEVVLLRHGKRDRCGKRLGVVPIPADTNLSTTRLIAMGHELLLFVNDHLLITSPFVLPLQWTILSVPFLSKFVRSHVVFGGIQKEKESKFGEPVNCTLRIHGKGIWSTVVLCRH